MLSNHFWLEPENCPSNADGKMLDPLLLRTKHYSYVGFFSEKLKKKSAKNQMKNGCVYQGSFFVRGRGTHVFYREFWLFLTGVRNVYTTVKKNNWYLKWFLKLLKCWKFQGNLNLIDIAGSFLNTCMVWVFKNSWKGI